MEDIVSTGHEFCIYVFLQQSISYLLFQVLETCSWTQGQAHHFRWNNFLLLQRGVQPSSVSPVLLPQSSLCLITTVEMIMCVCPWWKGSVALPISQKGREMPRNYVTNARSPGNESTAVSRENCRKPEFGSACCLTEWLIL